MIERSALTSRSIRSAIQYSGQSHAFSFPDLPNTSEWLKKKEVSSAGTGTGTLH